MKKWTKDEKRVLLSIIQHNPNNLQQAFKLAAKQLNRTEHAMHAQWYKYLRNEDTQFVLMSQHTIIPNSKNSLHKQQKRTLNLWNRLKRIFTK